MKSWRLRDVLGPALLAAWLWVPGVAGQTAAQEAPAAPVPEAGEPSQASSAREAEATGTVVGWLELEGPLREGPPPFAWVTSEEAGESLEDVLAQMRTVAEGSRYAGLVLYLNEPRLTLTQVHTLRAAIERLRDAGKRVLAFSERYDLGGYLLASAADLILLQHHGEVSLHGLLVEEMYLAGLLEKVGARADMVQIGRYKGAAEPLTRRGPSEEWDENLGSLLDDLYDQFLGAIAEGRGIKRADAEAIVGESWTMTDEQLLRRRVVDRLVDRDLIDVTEVEFGTSFTWDDAMGQSKTTVNMDNPFALFSLLFKEPTVRTRRPSLAVIRATGPIHMGDSTYGDGLFTGDSVGSRTLVEALGEADADSNIKGVLLRVDSPGGSALASEVIWQAIRQVSRSKPVYVSIGPTAASGGYYLACAGEQVFVSPQSILGSIGVVGGKIILGGLYEKVGISITRRGRGPNADLFNSVEPFTDAQREQVRRSMQQIYDQFTERVMIGRGNRLNNVQAVAEGRLFTGRQAVENGLADHVGDTREALRALADGVGLEEGAYDVVHLPPPMSLSQFLNEMFGPRGQASAGSPARATVEAHPLLTAARELLGPRGWEAARPVWRGLLLLRQEPVLTLMPTAIVIR